MRSTFYRSKYLVIDFFIYIVLCDFAMLVGYLFIVEYAGFNRTLLLAFLVISFLISLSIVSIVLFFPQTFVSRVDISTNGIRWFLYEKTIDQFFWDDIADINVEYRLYKKCIVLKINRIIHGNRTNEFYFNMDRRNLEILSQHCPNVSQLSKIKEIMEKKEYQFLRRIK